MNKKDLKEYLKADLYRYGGSTAKSYFLKVFSPKCSPGFRYTYFLRGASAHSNHSIRGRLFRMFLRHYRYKYGFQIPTRTKIGRGFYMGHFGTTVINGEAKIGENCNIAHLVTIGQTNRGKLKGCPKIGNMVWIGTGAVIVGNINIGNNVLVAPNSYVNFDVPADSMVIGNPGKVILNKEATKDYINFIYQNAKRPSSCDEPEK
ncbi:MAG: serine acetyltransferase [Patescibacteria group bacterium]|nr:serine acetyltransferase [Patescibacteria group bacterium]